MAEPTATERAIAEGARISEPRESSNFLDEWKAAKAEVEARDGVDQDDVPDGELDKTKAAERGADGRFKKPESEEPKTKADAKEKAGVEGKLTVKERVEIREEKRRLKESFAQREQQLAQREQQLQLRESALGESARARELFEKGDYDGAAKAAFGAKSWNDLNDGAARQFASPEYKRIKELEKKTAELAEERERERQAGLTAQQQAREQKILTDFRAGLAESLPKSEDATIAALAESDPAFVDAVFQRVVTAARAGEDLDPTDAAEEIVEQARAHYERIAKVFGGRPTSQAEAPRGASPDRAGRQQQPVKPQKHVSRSTAAETSAPPEFATDAEWIAFGAKALKRAAAEDEAAGRSNQW